MLDLASETKADSQMRLYPAVNWISVSLAPPKLIYCNPNLQYELNWISNMMVLGGGPLGADKVMRVKLSWMGLAPLYKRPQSSLIHLLLWNTGKRRLSVIPEAVSHQNFITGSLKPYFWTPELQIHISVGMSHWVCGTLLQLPEQINTHSETVLVELCFSNAWHCY